MATKYAKILSSFNTTINGMLTDLVSNSLMRTLNLLEKKIRSKNVTMFQELLSYENVINAAKAPRFPGISMAQPSYVKLGGLTSTGRKRRSDAKSERKDYRYLKRKVKMFSKNGFSMNGKFAYYMYTGQLYNYFNTKANPENLFGKPIIEFEQGGVKGSKLIAKTRKTVDGWSLDFRNKGGRPLEDEVFTMSGKLGRFVVDLFPKVDRLTRNMDLGKYFPKNVAGKLSNFQGGKHRMFMPQYMEWWVKVKMKRLINL